MKNYGSEVREQVEAIRRVLAEGVAGAEKILNRMDHPSQLVRFKESMLEMTMEYVVQLDMAAGQIHGHRQRLLERQMADIADTN